MTLPDLPDTSQPMPQWVGGRYDSEIPIDLEPDSLVLFSRDLDAEMKTSDGERQKIITQANKAERAYNLQMESDPIYEDAAVIQIPASTARVDRVASELSGAFDRDGSPIYRAIPLTTSMVSHAQHMEKMIHQILSKADAMRQIRLTIKRAVKVGTGVMVKEVVSRPIYRKDAEMDMFGGQQDKEEGQEYENVLIVRSVKIQDMYVSPANVQDIRDAAFVGERFQLPRWRFEDYVTDGFYVQPKDDKGDDIIMQRGYKDDAHGQSEENRRTGISGDTVGGAQASEFYDLVRGWIRWKPEGADRYKLYYVVFPMGQPTQILRLKESPYESLDRAPYTFWNVDEGDGTIYGRGYMNLLQDMQQELNDLHALRIEAARRAYSKVWVARKGSAMGDQIEARRGRRARHSTPDQFTDDVGELEGEAAGVAVIHPDEVFLSENPAQDLIGITLTEANPSYKSDEQIIQGYMDMATVDNSPLQGIRTAFEVRQAASESAAKLKQYLKMVASTGMRPMAEIVKAMVWDFLMPISDFSEDLRWIEYGDKSYPITRTDFFNGIALEPAGTTTSADEMVALTNTASLMSEFIPMMIQVPGIVPDVPRAVREIMKARARALGMQEYEEVFGLAEPTEADMQKAMMYRQLVMGQGQQGGFQMPQGIMGQEGQPGGGMPVGGNGGAVQGAPDVMSSMGQQAPQAATEMDGGNMGM